MSTSTAKFFELDKAFKRQQSDNDAREKQSSERIQQLERQQFSRFEELDKKLDSVQQSVSGQLDSFKESLLQSLSATPSVPDPAMKALEQQLSSLMTIVHDMASTSRASPDPMYSTPRRRKKTKSTSKLSSPAAHRNAAIVTNPMSDSPSQHDFDSTKTNKPEYAELKTDLESRYNEKTSPRRGTKS